MKKSLITLLFVASTSIIFAQNTRISEHNAIGWYNAFATVKVSPKVGIHGEFQWRRTGLLPDPQQNLFRVGVNYALAPGAQLRVGYALAETYPYSDTPLNGLGKQFTEHRGYQMLTLSEKRNRLEISHRFMLEQRWIGRFSSAALTREDDYLYLNRLRYMARVQFPLKGKAIENKTPYMAVYDEILVGFGKNVNENVFDQNRLGILLGYRFSNQFRLEGGYFNQILQVGREINGRNVFQYNTGFVVNTIFNFDATKKK